MDKPGLRTQVRERRKSGHTPSPDFVGRVLTRVPRGVICCYVALPGEPPTADLIEALLNRGDDVYLPIAADALRWTPATTSRPWRAWGLRPGPMPQPTDLPDPGAVIVPALAVDTHGHRLGQGGGYYDRFLPTVPRARTIALVWSGEVIDTIPAEAHDVTVDAWVIADE
jgi:5-formyltetrahydrofolate cyclo-ligase